MEALNLGLDRAVGDRFRTPEEVLVMNAGFDRHFSEEVWEEYALGRQSEEDCSVLEEHLLVCATCQDLLAEADDYIQAVAAAGAFLTGQNGEGDTPVTDSQTRRRLSKPVAAAATI